MKTFAQNQGADSVQLAHGAAWLALMIQVSVATGAQAAPKELFTDARINAAVEKALLYDSSVDSGELDVTAVDGVVTLSGATPSLIAMQRAVMITEAVKGVRAVVNNIDVNPIARSDAEIATDVKGALLADPATRSYDVHAAIRDGAVVLTGEVASWQEKMLAAAVATGVKGLKSLKNDIHVSKQPRRASRELAAAVRAALKRDVWVDDLLIDVEVEDGRVILTGTVGSAAEKSLADWNAHVAGAEAVDDSELLVDPWFAHDMNHPRRAVPKWDVEIEHAVKAALRFDPRTAAFEPEVSVSNGVATLIGTVGGLKAKRTAEQLAKRISGVWRVRNYLKVRGHNPPPNFEHAQQVTAALMRDPYLERYDIRVTARKGVIYLNGTVDSFYEKTHAEDVASRVHGISSINNNLYVSYPSHTYYHWPYSRYFYEPYLYNRPPTTSPTPEASDAEIKDEIEDELLWSPFVDADHVQVAVENGVATLAGKVGGWREYNAAIENAYQGGARSVISNLRVR